MCYICMCYTSHTLCQSMYNTFSESSEKLRPMHASNFPFTFYSQNSYCTFYFDNNQSIISDITILNSSSCLWDYNKIREIWWSQCLIQKTQRYLMSLYFKIKIQLIRKTASSTDIFFSFLLFKLSFTVSEYYLIFLSRVYFAKGYRILYTRISYRDIVKKLLVLRPCNVQRSLALRDFTTCSLREMVV